MEQLEYQLQRENEATRQQINKAIADRYSMLSRNHVLAPKIIDSYLSRLCFRNSLCF